jgi:hypothetical protein
MNAPTDNAAVMGSHSVGQLALGLFIVWQLVYLFGASFLAFWSASRPEVDAATMAVAKAADGWGALTGQWQGWALYGPNLPTQSAFVAVELRWEHETVQLRSECEPVDVGNYFRPFLSSRLSIYESYLGLVLWGWDSGAAAQEPHVWNERLVEHVAKERRGIEAYLRWRLERFQRDHPDRPPPAEVVLLGHIYPISAPGREPFFWSTPEEIPLARWRPPAAAWCDDYAPAGTAASPLRVETYNLITHQFEPLPGQR